MENIILQNEELTASIAGMGAELQSLKTASGTEYMWQAGEEWPKHSPVLFPVVGTLRNNSYIYNGKRFEMPRHGFARTMLFKVKEQTPTGVIFELRANEATREVYPFEFIFQIGYRLRSNRLSVEYLVENTGDGVMPFAIGGHPAFNVPMKNGAAYDDHYLQFEDDKQLTTYVLQDGLLSKEEKQIMLDEDNRLWLSKALFASDALVSTSHRSRRVTLAAKGVPGNLVFSFDGFPHLGIWAAKGADFVCIEPWLGHADWVDAPENVLQKTTLTHLQAGENCKRLWQVSVD